MHNLICYYTSLLFDIKTRVSLNYIPNVTTVNTAQLTLLIHNSHFQAYSGPCTPFQIERFAKIVNC